MSQIVVVSDAHGNVLGIAHQPQGGKIGITAAPDKGQFVEECDLPAEFASLKSEDFFKAVKVDRTGKTPALIKR
jgi:hypothetical protein